MMTDIIIGTVGSIVASVVIAVVLSVYEVNYKSKVMGRLSVIQNYVWMINNKCTYADDYTEVVHSAEEIIRIIREIGDHTKHINRVPECRKAFFTVLYDLQHRCERICFQTVGYDGREEISARIGRIKRENFDEDKCVLCDEVEILKQLINGRRPSISNNIIDVNSFKQGKMDDEYIRQYGLESKDFSKYIAR